jgi:monoamine oxidase
MKPDVIIIGAGAAGLAAAQVLSAEGASVLIVEARDRIGGRIFTCRAREFPIPVELGAEFVHGRPEVSWRMIRQAGLLAVDLPSDHRRRHGAHLSRIGDVNAELDKVMGGLRHLGSHDISFAAYLTRGKKKIPTEARRFAIGFVQGFDAADPERISAQSLADEHSGIGDLEDQTQFRLLDGYEALTNWLFRSLPRGKVTVRLNTSASEIRWSKWKVEVLVGSATQPKIFRASRAIITLPLGVLQMQPEIPGSIRFTPDIPVRVQSQKAAKIGGPMCR